MTLYNSEWILKPLSELCEIVIGRTPSRSKPEYWGKGYEWLSISDMNEKKYISVTKETITDEGASLCKDKLLSINTVVFSFKLSIGKVSILDAPMYTNEAIVGLPIKDPSLLYTDYLYYVLKTLDVSSKTDRAVMGATLNKKKLEQIKIPLPPLEEQKRIAKILDKADEIRHKRKESIRLTDELLRSTFLDMFGDIEGKKWILFTVEDIIKQRRNSIRTGPFGSKLLHSEFVDEGIAVLGIDNAVQNTFKWAKPRFITEEKYAQLKRFTVYPDDVLITIMGTCGRCAIVPSDCPKAINTKHLCCITLDQTKCLPQFLHSYFLIHPEAQKYLKMNAKGAIMDGLNMTIIKKLPVPLVPIDLQKDYQKIYQKYEKFKNQLQSYYQESENLFNSLLQRAFKGEL
ncbi:MULTISPECIES: restriction endonuclease subunit S [Crocosphaera]|uniref:Type I restriction-modification system,specificity subunit S n=3 Tax=Crocosphaera watsonii TaxID=263511 RepID=T2JZK6_CROWT|nr:MULTISPECIES: restriction endonuclease subunit S [Crocosphaera]EHJ14989.1 restriction modification system DNA specificity domain [Crocosphaera watsonii WH 0003]CCQ54189.1 Type I restriction-modification system,specificity subunit S [Crocosphaera watsonii WH 0005]CCQ70549.1 Type I restriction-modification system,specificity subunit S [Crocosphaera watsonii WH 0402]